MSKTKSGISYKNVLYWSLRTFLKKKTGLYKGFGKKYYDLSRWLISCRVLTGISKNIGLDDLRKNLFNGTRRLRLGTSTEKDK